MSCSCPHGWTLNVTTAGSPRPAPRKGSPSSRGSTGAQSRTSLVSIREAESASLHFSTGLICKQQGESWGRHESIFQISPALQPRSSYSAPVTAVTHLTASRQRGHGSALQLFPRGTQQYGGFSPGLLVLLPSTMLRAKIQDSREQAFQEFGKEMNLRIPQTILSSHGLFGSPLP